MSLNSFRKEIQEKQNLKIEDIANEIGISQKSIYRVEDIKNFKKSIFIKYLQYLNTQGYDINEFLNQLHKTNANEENHF